MPEPQARVNENKSGLSNTGKRTQQVSSLIRESTEQTATVSYRTIRPVLPALEKDSSNPNSDNHNNIGRTMDVWTPGNSSTDTDRSSPSPGTTSTTASSSTSASTPTTTATKTSKEELAPKVKARIQQIAKTGNYTFDEAARIWVQEEQRRIKEKFAVAPAWTSDRPAKNVVSDSNPVATSGFNYEQELGRGIAEHRAKQNIKFSSSSKDDYGNSR